MLETRCAPLPDAPNGEEEKVRAVALPCRLVFRLLLPPPTVVEVALALADALSKGEPSEARRQAATVGGAPTAALAVLAGGGVELETCSSLRCSAVSRAISGGTKRVWWIWTSARMAALMATRMEISQTGRGKYCETVALIALVCQT